MSSAFGLLRRHRSAIAWFLLFTWIPGCTAWKPGGPTPAQFVQTQRPRYVRVTLHDGTRLFVDNPVIEGDTLIGLQPHVHQISPVPDVRIPLATVDVVAVQRTDPLLTTGVLLGSALLLALIACDADSQNELSVC